MDTPENLVETPRNEMADSRGPDGEFLFPELRQATAAGDVVIDPEYMQPSLAGETGLDQPGAPTVTPPDAGASGAAEPVPAAEADPPIPVAATAGDPGLDQPDAPPPLQPDPSASGAAEPVT